MRTPLCSYDFMEINIGSNDPVKITDWAKLVRAIRSRKDFVVHLHFKDSDKTYFKLRSVYWGGSVMVSPEDARTLVNKYHIPLQECLYDTEGGYKVESITVRSM